MKNGDDMNDLYKLILVDDEDDIRGRISSMITAESGFEVIASAANGYDALELIEELKPHAVITDIKMPYIDGIQLAEEIKQEFPTVKVAFLTGYGEFDYARKAVELGIVSYLMKPVVRRDVKEYLEKLKQILDEEHDLIHNIEQKEQRFNNYKPLFIENQLNKFLMSSELTNEDIDTMSLYDLDFKDSNYIIGIVEFFSNSTLEERMKSETFIREYLSSALPQYQKIISFTTAQGLSFIIKNKDLFLSEVELSMLKLITSKENYDDVTIRVALSSIFTSMKDFPSKYNEASQVLQVSRFTNRVNVIAFDDIEQSNVKQVVLSPENINEINQVIRFEKTEEITKMFDRYIETFKKQHTSDSDNQLIIVTCANIIMNYAFSLGIDFNQHFNTGFMSKLLSIKNTAEILEITKKEIIKLRNCVIEKTNTKLTEITDQVVSYIEMNYADNSINMDTVADIFNVSVSYLSSLLKKEKGISFNKYLVQVRINKAKELLKYSDLKIVEVAKKVGYNDAYYFSHSFKKNTKVSPKEFRETN